MNWIGFSFVRARFASHLLNERLQLSNFFRHLTGIVTKYRYNQEKIWSSHLLDNLSNCLMNLKNSGDSTGFEPMTSAIPVQCSNQLSYEVTQWRAGQFVGLMFSRERNVIWKNVESPEFFRFMRQLLKLSSKCEDHIFTWFQTPHCI